MARRFYSRLQTVDYTYNIRGWLKQINNPNNLGNDLFAFKIGYNEGINPLYNGNISLTQWRTANTDNSLKTYNYTYDALNRIVSATDNLDRYSLSNVSYDKNGNILNLTRKGHIVAEPVWANSADFDLMDDLTYTYQPNSNKLLKVSDAIVTPSNVKGEFKDDHNQTTPDPTNDYTYDANGNMKTDTNKGITNINYNHLNLPTLISINGMGQTGTINYIYDATGVKMSKQVEKNGVPEDTFTYYAGNYIYEGSSLKFFSHPEGYVEPDGSSFNHIYQYKDHLGNIRLNYKDISTTSTPILEIIEENNYYPFGLLHKGYNNVVSSNANSVAQKYKYNGKELNDELGLDWYDYGARLFDVSIARWNGIDKSSENYYQNSPYHYAGNNPIKFVDIDGNDYGVTVNRPNQPGGLGTITVSATYLVHSNHSASVNNQVANTFGNASGNKVFVSGGVRALKQGNATAFQVNFDINTQVENNAVNRTASVSNDQTGTLNKIDTFTAPYPNALEEANGSSNNDRIGLREDRVDTKTTPHEVAHTLGVDHKSDNGSLPTQGIKVNNKLVNEVLAGVGIGGNNTGRNSAGGNSPGAGDGTLLNGSTNQGLQTGQVISLNRYNRIVRRVQRREDREQRRANR